MAHKTNVTQVKEKITSKNNQEMVSDPVCKKKFRSVDCKHIIYLQEKAFHFCSKECRNKFARNLSHLSLT